MDTKPRSAIVKMTRTVTEIARVVLDRDGNIVEIDEVIVELDSDDCTVHSIRSVLSVHP